MNDKAQTSKTSVNKMIAAISFAMLLVFVCLDVISVSARDTVTIKIRHDIISEPATAPLSEEIKGEVYEFILTRVTPGAPLPDGANGESAVRAITGKGDTVFSGFDFRSAGRFEYELREKEGTRENVRYDKTVYRVIINALGPDDVTCIIKAPNGEKPDAASFVDTAVISPEEFNGGELEEPIQSEIFAKGDMKKLIKGSGKYSRATFRFTATPDADTRALGQDKELTTVVKGEGKILFPEITITRTGDYAYIIREVASDKANWKYDKRKYKYCFTVTATKGDDGSEVAKVSQPTIVEIDGADEKEITEARFENEPTIRNRVISVVKTGDPQQFMVLIVMLVAAALALTFILAAPKRRK